MLSGDVVVRLVRRCRAGLGVAAAVAVLVGAGCTSDDDEDTAPGTTTTTVGSGSSTVPAGPDGAERPTAAEEAMAGRFLEFADRPDQAHADRVPFAARVQLGLGADLLVTRSRSELAAADAWLIDVEIYRAYAGPFSALTVVRDAPETMVSVGEHTACASPPVPAPPGTEHLRQLSVQPAPHTYDGCLQWWSVDLFVNADGQIEAVTMDLYEP